MKPFKTISLVDRLKASTYDEVSELKGKAVPGAPSGTDLPHPPKAAQAEELKLSTPTPPPQIVELKKLQDQVKRNIEILKIIRGPRSNQKLIEPSAFATKPLVSFLLPKPNENFASVINLENRLAQPNIAKSTRHLPHFFLSDFYTDYITITKFGIFNHTSITKVNKFITNSNRDGQNILPYNFDPIIFHGVKLTNGQFISLIDPKTPTQNVLTLQGTFFTNGAFISQTQTQEATGQSIILTLQGTFFRNGEFISQTNIEDAVEVVAQGGQKAFAAKSSNVITLMQGVLINNAGTAVSITTITLPGIVSKPTQEPNKAQYFSDRSLSILLPRVKHGTVFLQRPDFGQIIFNHGTINIQRTNFGDNSFVQFIQGLQGISPEGTESSQILPIKNFQNKNFDGQKLETVQGENYFQQNQPPATRFPTTEELLRSIQSFQYQRAGRRQGTGVSGNTRPSPTTGRIRRAGSFRESGQPPTPHYNIGRDFIELKISGVTFPALLTSLSDSWSPSWSDQNFIGRQDTFKNFKGVTRSVSMGFKVVAWSGGAQGMWTKLDKLIKVTAVGEPAGNYVKGPIVKLTVGGLFRNVTCVCTSLKIDTNPAEYTWDLSGHPMIADISLDLAMLTDNKGQLFNAKSNTYYG